MDKLFYGQGKLYAAVRDTSGVPGVFSYLGNCPSLTISPGKKNVRYATDTSQGGIVPAMHDDEGVTKLDAILDSISSSNLALVLHGARTVQALASVAGEAVIAYTAGMVPLAHPNVSAASVVVKNAAENITYTSGTHYVLNAAHGTLTFPTGTTIADTQVLHIWYDHGAYDKIGSFTSAMPYLWLRFDGFNVADNSKPIIVDFFKVRASFEGDLSLIGDSFSSVHLIGTVQYDDTQPTDVAAGKVFRVRRV